VVSAKGKFPENIRYNPPQLPSCFVRLSPFKHNRYFCLLYRIQLYLFAAF